MNEKKVFAEKLKVERIFELIGRLTNILLIIVKRRAIIVGVLGISLIIGIASPYFFSISNFLNITIAVSINGIMACGMAFVIISGGIDLSVGALLALGGAVSAGFLGAAFTATPKFLVLPWPLAALAGVAVTTLLGLISGLIITKFNIPSLVVTLGMMSVARGLTYIFSDFVLQQTTGSPITFYHPGFEWLGGGYVGGIPVPTIIFFCVILLCWWLLNFVKYGRNLYAVGGDEEVARLAGINTHLTKIIAFTLMGALAGLSGVILTARLSSASPVAGFGYELNVISAAVIGGTSLAGGEGTAIGVVAGVFIIGILGNGLNLLNVPSFYQYIMKGWILIAAVALDSFSKRQLKKRI